MGITTKFGGGHLIVLGIMGALLCGCATPFESISTPAKIAIVSVHYDPNIYAASKNNIDYSQTYATYSKTPKQERMHEEQLNQFLIDLMTQTRRYSDISIVRPLRLLNTSLFQNQDAMIRYEYLLDPYDPIDINDRVFMTGIAKRLKVDAVMFIGIAFAIHVDQTTLWDEYKNPHEQTVSSFRMQLKKGHQSSVFKTSIQMVVVDQMANEIYKETRFVDTVSEHIRITNQDLEYDGGVSPQLISAGLSDWLRDWKNYISIQGQ